MGDNNMISSSSTTSVFDINYEFALYNNNVNVSDDHIRPFSSDEISQFLRQILVRSSLPSALSPSSSTAPTHRDPHAEIKCFSSPPPDAVLNREIPAVDFPHSGACFSGNPTTHVSSSSVGARGNETDEYDCDSEEGIEAVVDEPPVKPAPSRSSSKRSRAAEVHNLSEKRRRSRINEKMKALQKLIPNSNKTDKASMLDEAIEYLKQLQLQVQMLTMRNGLSLHPMSLPGAALCPMQLTRTRMDIGEHNNVSPRVNMTSILAGNQHNQLANIPEIMNSGSSSFGLESSIKSHFGPFPILNSSEKPFKEVNHEDMRAQDPMNINDSKTNLPEFEAGAIPAASLPFDPQASDLKDNLT